MITDLKKTNNIIIIMPMLSINLPEIKTKPNTRNVIEEMSRKERTKNKTNYLSLAWWFTCSSRSGLWFINFYTTISLRMYVVTFYSDFGLSLLIFFLLFMKYIFFFSSVTLSSFFFFLIFFNCIFFSTID